MHVRDLVELAARIAVSASSDLLPVQDPQARSIQTYWSAARCRTDRWTRAIRRQGEMILRGEITSREAWTRFEPLFQEILASELVSRIVAAVSAAHDAHRKTAELEPVARNVFTAHLEVRNKVLQLLLTGERHGVAAAKKLNDFRRRVERWTDLLLAHLPSSVNVHDFAFEPCRSAEFADDLKSGGTFDEQHLAKELLFSSFRGSLLAHLTGASPNADLNETIGRSLNTLFHKSGHEDNCEVGWLARISQMTDDAQEMLDEIVAMEAV